MPSASHASSTVAVSAIPQHAIASSRLLSRPLRARGAGTRSRIRSRVREPVREASGPRTSRERARGVVSQLRPVHPTGVQRVAQHAEVERCVVHDERPPVHPPLHLGPHLRHRAAVRGHRGCDAVDRRVEPLVLVARRLYEPAFDIGDAAPSTAASTTAHALSRSLVAVSKSSATNPPAASPRPARRSAFTSRSGPDGGVNDGSSNTGCEYTTRPSSTSSIRASLLISAVRRGAASPGPVGASPDAEAPALAFLNHPIVRRLTAPTRGVFVPAGHANHDNRRRPTLPGRTPASAFPGRV